MSAERYGRRKAQNRIVKRIGKSDWDLKRGRHFTLCKRASERPW